MRLKCKHTVFPGEFTPKAYFPHFFFLLLDTYTPSSGKPHFENITQIIHKQTNKQTSSCSIFHILLRYISNILSHLYYKFRNWYCYNKDVIRRSDFCYFQKSWSKAELEQVLWNNPGKSPGQEIFLNNVSPRDCFLQTISGWFYAFLLHQEEIAVHIQRC